MYTKLPTSGLVGPDDDVNGRGHEIGVAMTYSWERSGETLGVWESRALGNLCITIHVGFLSIFGHKRAAE